MFSVSKSIQNAGRAVLHAFYDIKITGQLPKSKTPLVLIANHSGLIDGPLLFCATNRTMAVLTKTEVFNQFTRPILNTGLAIETDWKDADRSAVVNAQRFLAEGFDVGLFPEGTRCRGNFAWLKDGVVLINAKEHSDFIPVFIFGSRLTGRSKNWIPPYKSLIEIVIGNPIQASDVYSNDFDVLNRKHIAIAGERLRQSLQLQMQAAQATVSNELPEDDVSE